MIMILLFYVRIFYYCEGRSLFGEFNKITKTSICEWDCIRLKKQLIGDEIMHYQTIY